MKEPSFTLEELVAFLQGQHAQERDLSDYHTTSEWCQIFGLAENRVRRLVREGLAAGIIRREEVRQLSIDGRMFRKVAYAFRVRGESTGKQDGDAPGPVPNPTNRKGRT